MTDYKFESNWCGMHTKDVRVLLIRAFAPKPSIGKSVINKYAT